MICHSSLCKFSILLFSYSHYFVKVSFLLFPIKKPSLCLTKLANPLYVQDFAKSADLKLRGILKAFQTFEVLHCKKTSSLFLQRYSQDRSTSGGWTIKQTIFASVTAGSIHQPPPQYQLQLRFTYHFLLEQNGFRNFFLAIQTGTIRQNRSVQLALLPNRKTGQIYFVYLCLSIWQKKFW